LKAVRDSLEKSYFMQQPAIEEKARNMEPAAMQKYLNDYSVTQAQRMLARWKQLATYLIVKYNDMAVKPDENGRFTRNKYGLGERVKRPGYSTAFARRIAKETGDRYLAP
jgi:hypothetical protein